MTASPGTAHTFGRVPRRPGCGARGGHRSNRDRSGHFALCRRAIAGRRPFSPVRALNRCSARQRTATPTSRCTSKCWPSGEPFSLRC